MRNSKRIDTIAIVSASAALVSIVLWSHPFAPRFNRNLHAAIGKVLAQEAISLGSGNGRITVMTRDTATFPQPALDILLKSFRHEMRRQGGKIHAIQVVEQDPLRPVEVPPGDFFELIRRSSAEDVIVSLLGPPLFSQEQRKNLASIKPKIVAFCPGEIGQHIDLRQLFKAGLIHVAIVSRSSSSSVEVAHSSQAQHDFDQLYRVVRMNDVQALPSLSES